VDHVIRRLTAQERVLFQHFRDQVGKFLGHLWIEPIEPLGNLALMARDFLLRGSARKHGPAGHELVQHATQ
jgi:hypothetical protein